MSLDATAANRETMPEAAESRVHPPGTPMIDVRGLSKAFTLHHQGGVRLPVLDATDLRVATGECVVLRGPSGAGKSSLLRCLYGNYLAQAGEVHVRGSDGWVDVARAPARRILELRRRHLGYVSQFLRAIPRVPAEQVVAQPAIDAGTPHADALEAARTTLARLNIPDSLWHLPPATFSGGEQQRVNVARAFARDFPILLLDEPTASLDAANRAVVVELVNAARERGAAIVGIFHDPQLREAVATRIFDLPGKAEAA
jgi:alpha-D-ribose 1-methylphosphonate 5-triphosphate synthase subunit PhnL